LVIRPGRCRPEASQHVVLTGFHGSHLPADPGGPRQQIAGSPSTEFCLTWSVHAPRIQPCRQDASSLFGGMRHGRY
jgi:hypothetical protein